MDVLSNAAPNPEAIFSGPIARLPLEVLHHIMAQLAVHTSHIARFDLQPLYDSVEAEAKVPLAACTLVSRKFRLAALPHLFHTIAFWIRHPIESQALPGNACLPAQEGSSRGCRTLVSFRRFIDASTPVRIYIRELRIGAGESPYASLEFDVVEFLSLLHRLPNLRSVELDIAFWPVRRELDTLPRLGPPLFLDRLTIVGGFEMFWDDCDVVTGAKLAPLFKQLDGIGVLRFHEVAFQYFDEVGDPDNSDDFSLVSALKGPISVKVLSFDNCLHPNAIIAGFDNGPELALRPAALKSVVLCGLREDLPQIVHALSVFGANLRKFTFEFQSPMGDEPCKPPPPPLQRVPTDLCVCYRVQRPDQPWPPFLPRTPRAHAQVVSRRGRVSGGLCHSSQHPFLPWRPQTPAHHKAFGQDSCPRSLRNPVESRFYACDRDRASPSRVCPHSHTRS